MRPLRGNEECMRKRTTQCTESGAKCVLRHVALERDTNIDEGNVKWIKNREDQVSFQTSFSLALMSDQSPILAMTLE